MQIHKVFLINGPQVILDLYWITNSRPVHWCLCTPAAHCCHADVDVIGLRCACVLCLVASCIYIIVTLELCIIHNLNSITHNQSTDLCAIYLYNKTYYTDYSKLSKGTGCRHRRLWQQGQPAATFIIHYRCSSSPS